MLKYLIQTTEQLILMAISVGIAFGYMRLILGDRAKRMMQVTAIVSFALSAVMSVMKNTTGKIETGRWNLWIFGLYFLFFVLFLIISALGKKWEKARTMLPAAAVAGMIVLAVFYALPDVLAYPYAIYTGERTFLSTNYLYKFIGMLGGLLLVFLTGLAAYKGTVRLEKKKVFGLLFFAELIVVIKQVLSSISVMLAKRILRSNHTLFTLAKYGSNYSRFFIYGLMVLGLIIAVALLVRSAHVNEPYNNSAERRKIIAKWRITRRWSVLMLVCLACILSNMTWLKQMANRTVELSPTEDAPVENGYVVVPFERVSDGHLHRFGYTTDGGVTIRFIVIQKPNSSSYGIGLDACDICGETGYYEKDGQVVCNLCDVVMNINTIGFKGGCNPIVIPYEISDGTIRVPVDGLAEHEKEFR